MLLEAAAAAAPVLVLVVVVVVATEEAGGAAVAVAPPPPPAAVAVAAAAAAVSLPEPSVVRGGSRPSLILWNEGSNAATRRSALRFRSMGVDGPLSVVVLQ